MKLFLLLFLLVPFNVEAVTLKADNVAATSTMKVPGATTLPATCDAGPPAEVFIDTNATSGQRLYLCESTNTWALQGDGAGGGSGSMTTTKEEDTPVGDADIVILDFGAGFDLVEIPNTEMQITLDLTEKQVDLTTEVTGVLPDGNIDSAISRDSELTTHTGNASAHHTATVDTNANTVCTGTTTYLDGEGGCDDISAVYEPAGITESDISDLSHTADTTLNLAGAETITGNWVSTANPWADNEVVDTITASNYLLLAGGSVTGAVDTTANMTGINYIFNGATSGSTTLLPAAVAGTTTITMPATTGTMALTSDCHTIQKVITTDATDKSGTTITILDDTIPQNTEGNEFITVTITPTTTTTTLVITYQVFMSASIADHLVLALFQDTTANALHSWVSHTLVGNISTSYTGQYEMASGTTSATTFKLRAGTQSAGTTYFNTVGATAVLGDTQIGFIKIVEYENAC